MTNELTADDCWALLTRTHIGRLAVVLGDGVDIFPVNFLAKDGAIYFRSAPGSKLMDLTAAPMVAFEADGRKLGRRWSVVAKGPATRLDHDDEIEASGVLALSTATPTDKWNYVRISPTLVTGRRL